MLAIICYFLQKNGPSFARKTTKASAGTGEVYFETAIRLGTVIGAANGHAKPEFMIAIKRIFNLSNDRSEDLEVLYDKQIQTPLSIKGIVAPFVDLYGSASASGEPLIAGMSSLALGYGDMTRAELSLIRASADALGFNPAATRRMLMSAGYFGDEPCRASRTGASLSTLKSDQNAERCRHLDMLSLPPEADRTSIRKAWRDLVMQHHPDRLASQGLSQEDQVRAENQLQQINEAYKWLKENNL